MTAPTRVALKQVAGRRDVYCAGCGRLPKRTPRKIAKTFAITGEQWWCLFDDGTLHCQGCCVAGVAAGHPCAWGPALRVEAARRPAAARDPGRVESPRRREPGRPGPTGPSS